MNYSWKYFKQKKQFDDTCDLIIYLVVSGVALAVACVFINYCLN